MGEGFGDELMQEDTIQMEAALIEDQQETKKQKRKTQWGPTQRIPRPRRYPEDGKTMMQKAQEYKSYLNLSRGTKPYNLKHVNTSSTLESNLISLTARVDIVLGDNNNVIKHNIDVIQNNEMESRLNFLDNNPDVKQPIDLDDVLAPNNRTDPLVEQQTNTSNPLKENRLKESYSWVQIVNKGLEASNILNISNNRSNMEH